MHRKKEDFILQILKEGVRLIICGIIVGFLITLMNLIVSTQKIAITTPLNQTAKASLIFFKKKEKIHRLKISAEPSKVKVIKVKQNNKIVVRGTNTYPKTISLYLITLPPEDCYKSNEAHQELKKLINDKYVYIYSDSQSTNQSEVYLQKGNSLIQEKLLKKGLAVMYNYNGSEKYYDLLKQDQNKAKNSSKGVWVLPGYVTNNGYSVKVGSLHE